MNELNQLLLYRVNETGKVYMSHTKLSEKFTLRMVIGQTNVTEQHVNNAWKLIQQFAEELS